MPLLWFLEQVTSAAIGYYVGRYIVSKQSISKPTSGAVSGELLQTPKRKAIAAQNLAAYWALEARRLSDIADKEFT